MEEKSFQEEGESGNYSHSLTLSLHGNVVFQMPFHKELNIIHFSFHELGDLKIQQY